MNKKPLVVAMAIALNSAAMNVAAEVNTSEFDEVVVSATRVSEKASETSRSILVVNSEQLETAQAASVPEALANSANITVSNGPRSSSQGVEIRGLSGARVLQTIDGARQNTVSGHRGSFFIEPEMLQSIEVIRGPAGSLWGSGAIGGVVAQNTKSAQDFLDEDEQFGAYLKQGYETNGSRTKTSGAIYGLSGGIDWLLNGSYYDSNDIKTGDDQVLTNSASLGSSALGKLGWQLDASQRLEISARQNHTNELAPSNPSANVSNSVPLVRRNTDDQNVTAQYQLNPSDNPYLDARAQVYWNNTQFDEDRVTKNQLDSTQYQTLGFSINNRSVMGNSVLSYGVDGYRDTYETVRDDSGQAGQRPGNIDGETQVWGAFTQASVGLTDSLTFEAGVRFDSFENQSHNLDTSASDNEWSPSAALMWQAQSWLTLSARYEQAFRAPNVEEMFSTGTHYCIPSIPGFLPDGLCNTFEINPDLRSETARNKEIKADLRFADLMGDDELAVTVNVFRNDVDDLIVQQVSNPLMGIPGFEQTTSWNNVKDAQLDGFELDARYRIGQTRIAMNYGETQGEDNDTGDYIDGMPANKFHLDVSQGVFEGDIKLGARFTWVDSQTEVPAANSITQYDGYQTWDMYAAWEPAMGTFEGLRVDLAVDNIGDEKYVQAWQTLFEQGRNIKLSARYQF